MKIKIKTTVTLSGRKLSDNRYVNEYFNICLTSLLFFIKKFKKKFDMISLSFYNIIIYNIISVAVEQYFIK